MSLILDPTWQAFDSNGNVIVGATLTVYNTGGTVLASIWRDAALTVPMTNPTSGTDKSNAAGRFPRFYAAEGALFDLVLKDQGGSTIDNPLSVPALGAVTGALVRDFTTSRFQARGSGGTTFIEAGDPAGDDIGGSMSFGGWNGTQADLITLNGALVNVAGRLKENSKKLPGVVYTEATAFSGATSVVIALPNDPVGVRGWQIDILDFAVVTADDTVFARFSYDGGATFKSGASDYGYFSTYFSGTNVTNVDTEMGLFADIEHTAVPKGRATIRVSSPLGFDSPVVEATAALRAAAGLPFYYQAAAWGLGGYGRPTHIKLYCNSSQIAGIYRVIPERGFGEV